LREGIRIGKVAAIQRPQLFETGVPLRITQLQKKEAQYLYPRELTAASPAAAYLRFSLYEQRIGDIHDRND
jgi:hypothetical protein